jgi:Ca2+-binding RTX toxin-like protein
MTAAPTLSTGGSAMTCSNDVLNGGFGSYVLTGGVGREAFVFNTALGPTNLDQVSDFSAADDTVRLDSAVFDGPCGPFERDETP